MSQDMSQDLNLLVQGIVKKREASLPVIEKRLAVLNSLETKINHLQGSSWGNRDVAASISALRPELNALRQVIADAKRDIEQARLRFSRKNLSIAIAGKARQGKSQMLQMLTGLSDDQIPTGGNGFCTAARSVIYNDPGKQYAEINYLPEYELMTSKIIQAYRQEGVPGQLGLSPEPSNIADFKDSALPKLMATDPSSIKFYKVLQELHDALKRAEVFACIGRAKERKNINELRPYLTRDDESLIPYFHVVKNVEIHTPFELGLPENMKVFDLPGLGEMSPNIRTNMMKAVSEEADIVMLLRRPDASGDDWREDDYQLLDDLKKLFEGDRIQPCDWVALILNLDMRGSGNYKQVEAMMRHAPEGFQPIKCNCGDKMDVRRVIIENMTHLIDNADKIDKVSLARSESSYRRCVDEGKKLIDKLKDMCSEIGGGSAIFNENFEEFMANLRGPFQVPPTEQLKVMNDTAEKILGEAFSRIREIMAQAYKDREGKKNEKFPSCFPIFNVNQIEIKLKAGRGPEDGVNAAVRNQLWAILHLLKQEMTKCCADIKGSYLESMVDLILDKNPAMRHIVEEEELPETTTAKEKLETVIGCMERIRCIPDLIEALNNLVNVPIEYETQILPYFHHSMNLRNFDPTDNDARNSKDANNAKDHRNILDLNGIKEQIRKRPTSYTENAEMLFKWMRIMTLGIVSCDSDTDLFKRISFVINMTFNANYKNFVMQFIFGNTVEQQWHDFAYEERRVLWKQAYEEEAQKSEFGKALRNIISDLQSAIRESPQHLLPLVEESEKATSEN